MSDALALPLLALILSSTKSLPGISNKFARPAIPLRCTTGPQDGPKLLRVSRAARTPRSVEERSTRM